MRQAATLYIFGFALLLIFFFFLASSLSIVHRVAVVDAVAGAAHVRVHGEGEPIALEEGRLVRAGDVVHTGPGSSVELRWARWAGGMRVKIDENTTFQVVKAIARRASDEEQSRLRIDQGSIWVRLRKTITGKSKFEVETPTAVAAVRGTVFRVAVAGDGGVEVSVWEGEVTVRGTGRDEVAVTDGKLLAVPRHGQPRAPRAITAAEQEQWKAQSTIVGTFLALRTPEEGAVCDASACEVSGRAEPGCDVFVGETEVDVAKDGTFSLTIALYNETNIITVTARTKDGRETVFARQVVVQAGTPGMEEEAGTVDASPAR